jgi:hypothetical protein
LAIVLVLEATSGCGGEATSSEATCPSDFVADRQRRTGLTYQACGHIGPTSSCFHEPLALPTAEQAAALACLSDAMESCTPASVSYKPPAIDFGPVQRLFVEPSAAGCNVVVVTDERLGRPARGTVTEAECVHVTISDTCPYLTPVECGSSQLVCEVTQSGTSAEKL